MDVVRVGMRVNGEAEEDAENSRKWKQTIRFDDP